MPHAGVSRFGVSSDAGAKKQPSSKPEGIGCFRHSPQSGSTESAPTGYGCVATVWLRASCGTLRSSIGISGLPVSRSSMKR